MSTGQQGDHRIGLVNLMLQPVSSVSAVPILAPRHLGNQLTGYFAISGVDRGGIRHLFWIDGEKLFLRKSRDVDSSRYMYVQSVKRDRLAL